MVDLSNVVKKTFCDEFHIRYDLGICIDYIYCGKKKHLKVKYITVIE